MPAANLATSKAGCGGEACCARSKRWRRSRPSPVLGVVYGAGFEDRPELLRLIAERWPLLGNDADTVSALKSPAIFFAELDRLGIPHPATTCRRPARAPAGSPRRSVAPAAAISCRVGSPRTPPASISRSTSLGRAVSALFIANGTDARVLGFSEQWTAPKPRSLWRYGGAVRPAFSVASDGAGDDFCRCQPRPCFRIKGLASADFLVRDGKALLLEINPRPGATLDIFDCGATPLLRLHVDAVKAGKLPSAPAEIRGCHGLGNRLCRSPAARRLRDSFGPNGRRIVLSHRNGSTKTVRYALWWRAVAPNRAPNA